MPSKRNSVGSPGRQGQIPNGIRLPGNSVAEPGNSAQGSPDQEKKNEVEQDGTSLAEERTESCPMHVAREHFSEQLGNIHDNETMLLEILSKLRAGDTNTAIRMLEILDHHVQASPDPKNRVLIPYIQTLLATGWSQSHIVKKPKNIYKTPSLSQFWILFFSVFALTIFCGVMSCYLSVHYANDAVRSLNEKLQSVFTLGCGSIIGMLGARRLTN
jgi:hypothetical protein